MKEETSRWLEPMLKELQRTPDATEQMYDLMRQATMPAAEANTPFVDFMAKLAAETPGMHGGAIDWIRFGQLLRERLGWSHYPDQPDFGAGNPGSNP